MTIDKFVYDPTTQKGELAVNATKGVFRIIGGRISKTSTIAVTTRVEVRVAGSGSSG